MASSNELNSEEEIFDKGTQSLSANSHQSKISSFFQKHSNEISKEDETNNESQYESFEIDGFLLEAFPTKDDWTKSNQEKHLESPKREWHCKYCEKSWSPSHFRNAQQFGAHCSQCSRKRMAKESKSSETPSSKKMKKEPVIKKSKPKRKKTIKPGCKVKVKWTNGDFIKAKVHSFSQERDLEFVNVHFTEKNIKKTVSRDMVYEDSSSESEDTSIESILCIKCKDGRNEEDLLLCDRCDKGWHTFCLDPPRKSIPKGQWFCPNCEKKSKKPHTTDATPSKETVKSEPALKGPETPPKQQIQKTETATNNKDAENKNSKLHSIIPSSSTDTFLGCEGNVDTKNLTMKEEDDKEYYHRLNNHKLYCGQVVWVYRNHTWWPSIIIPRTSISQQLKKQEIPNGILIFLLHLERCGWVQSSRILPFTESYSPEFFKTEQPGLREATQKAMEYLDQQKKKALIAPSHPLANTNAQEFIKLKRTELVVEKKIICQVQVFCPSNKLTTYSMDQWPDRLDAKYNKIGAKPSSPDLHFVPEKVNQDFFILMDHMSRYSTACVVQFHNKILVIFPIKAVSGTTDFQLVGCFIPKAHETGAIGASAHNLGNSNVSSKFSSPLKTFAPSMPLSGFSSSSTHITPISSSVSGHLSRTSPFSLKPDLSSSAPSSAAISSKPNIFNSQTVGTTANERLANSPLYPSYGITPNNGSPSAVTMMQYSTYSQGTSSSENSLGKRSTVTSPLTGVRSLNPSLSIGYGYAPMDANSPKRTESSLPSISSTWMNTSFSQSPVPYQYSSPMVRYGPDSKHSDRNTTNGPSSSFSPLPSLQSSVVSTSPPATSISHQRLQKLYKERERELKKLQKIIRRRYCVHGYSLKKLAPIVKVELDRMARSHEYSIYDRHCINFMIQDLERERKEEQNLKDISIVPENSRKRGTYVKIVPSREEGPTWIVLHAFYSVPGASELVPSVYRFFSTDDEEVKMLEEGVALDMGDVNIASTCFNRYLGPF